MLPRAGLRGRHLALHLRLESGNERLSLVLLLLLLLLFVIVIYCY